MKPAYSRRSRHSCSTTRSEGAFFKKESSEPAFFDTPAPTPFFTSAPTAVQRKCDKCEEQDKPVQHGSTTQDKKKGDDRPIHRKHASGLNAASPGADIAGALNSGGQTMPANLNWFFSNRIGHDFSAAKIHTDSKAAQSAKAINAKAYTLKNHIVFAEGQYKPDTQEGKKLIAHELTHVVQQSGTAPSLQRAPDTKDELQKTYNINIKKGDKDWSAAEVVILKNALSRLGGDETSVLRDYQFIRWSTKEARAKTDTSYKDSGASECALHEMDFSTASYKISVYDACFGDPEAKSDTTFGIDTGEFHIMHEIGHAMEQAELRKTYEAATAADKAYNDYIEKNKDKDVTKAMQAGADKLNKAAEDAKQAMTDATGRGLKEFTGLMKGKDAITKYGGEGDSESFAEMFAAFKANPELVKKDYPAVYEWLSGKGFLKHIVKKK